MIYITEEQAKQVQYLLEQAMQGNHILFEPQVIKRALHQQKPLQVETSYGVEPQIEKLLSLPTLREKRSFLEQLDETTFEQVVCTYLNIVENTLFEAKGVAH